MVAHFIATKRMNRRGVILGFSGGMDSTTAALRLRHEGYRVIALTLDCTGDSAMLRRAEQRAKECGVEWQVYDAREEFRREIIDYFVESYRMGLTPAPCTRCNTLIKWRLMERVADSLGIEHIATGHYFNIEQHGDRLFVARGKDSSKDQSYYLWGLGQSTLQRALTPMGGLIKSEIREAFDDRSESMGVCFLGGEHYADFIARRGVELRCGEVLLRSGEVCGEHNGIARYTIGQRRGAGIPEGMRVVDIDAANNRLRVGGMEELYKHHLYIRECNITDRDMLLSAKDITIKIRGIGRNPERSVEVEPWGDGYAIFSPEAAWAPAKGQPLVFFRNNLVIGGGIVVDYK